MIVEQKKNRILKPYSRLGFELPYKKEIPKLDINSVIITSSIKILEPSYHHIDFEKKRVNLKFVVKYI
jgi:hypothetical protein